MKAFRTKPFIYTIIFFMIVTSLLGTALGVTPAYAAWSFSTRHMSDGLGASQVFAVVVSNNTIYAATLGGVSISIDGGDTFVNRTSANGLGTNGYTSFVRDVFVSGSNVYAATYPGLSISTDGGNTFTQRTTANGLANYYYAPFLSAAIPSMLAHPRMGYPSRRTGGDTFITKTTANGLGSNSICDIFDTGAALYVATTGGLSISTDNGETYTTKTTANGLGSNGVNAVFASGSMVYAATVGGLSISTDGGENFTNKTIADGLGYNNINNLFVDGSTIYAATTGGLSISTDGGESFTNKTTADGLGHNFVHSIFVVGSTIYAATEDGLSIGADVDNTIITPSPTPVVNQSPSISAGVSHVCWLKSNGTIICWGNNSNGQATPPSGIFKQLSVGNYHSCAVRNDDKVICWGAGKTTTGMYGDRGQSQAPYATTFKQVSAGALHSCGLKTDNTIFCWGSDAYHQTEAPAGTFTQIDAGAYFTCGIRTDTTIACWGDNYGGRATPPLDGNYTQISANIYTTCALKSDDSITCWGPPTSVLNSIPVGTYTQVDVGEGQACAKRTDGTFVCWGENFYGQSNVPTETTFTQISAGSGFTCALKTDGNPTCWGDNSYNQSFPFSISGNAGVGGATLSYTDGFSKMVTADVSGNYIIPVSYNWSGVVTPTYPGYTFASANKSYSDILANQSGENYTAIPNDTATPTVTAAKTMTPTASATFTPTRTATPTATRTATPTLPTVAKVFLSDAAQDGWVLESSENSNTGGSMYSAGAFLLTGDDAAKKQYRSILSFNTSALPDAAIITKLTLKVKKNGFAGGDINLMSSFQGLMVDMKYGFFGATPALEIADFQNAAGQSYGPFSPSLTSSFYYIDLTNAKGYVNKLTTNNGLTQLRLRFKLDDNNNAIANNLSLNSGNAATAADRPQLVVTYYLP